MRVAIIVYHDPDVLGVHDLHHMDIVRILQQGVSGAMTCDDPNGELVPGDVGVRFSPTMVNGLLRFEVNVDWLAAREANLGARETSLGELLTAELPTGQRFQLEVKLLPADSLVPNPVEPE